MSKYICEFVGTFALVFFGCATVLFMRSEVGLLGVAMAFGLSVVAMAYSIGPISGAHLNPAVSLGVFVSGRMKYRDLVGYVVAQCLGAIVASAVLYVMAQGKGGGYDVAANGFAQNGWSAYSATSAFCSKPSPHSSFCSSSCAPPPKAARALWRAWRSD